MFLKGCKAKVFFQTKSPLHAFLEFVGASKQQVRSRKYMLNLLEKGCWWGKTLLLALLVEMYANCEGLKKHERHYFSSEFGM